MIFTLFKLLLYFLDLRHSLVLPKFIKNIYLVLIVMKIWHERCVNILKIFYGKLEEYVLNMFKETCIVYTYSVFGT